MKNIISPLQAKDIERAATALEKRRDFLSQYTRDPVLVKFAADLMEIHQNLIDKMSEVKEAFSKNKGEKGDPYAEEDALAALESLVASYTSRQRLEEIIEDLIPEVRDGEDGEDGETPSKDLLISLIAPIAESMIAERTKNLDTSVSEKSVRALIKKSLPKKSEINLEALAKRVYAFIMLANDKEQMTIDPIVLVKALDTLPEGSRLKLAHIDGLEQTIRSYFANGGKPYLHGGGDTIKAGTGISVAANSDGTKTVSATGTVALTVLIATGTVDDSNKSFTFTSLPTLININGAFYRQTGGAITWTWNAGTTTATLSVAVGTGGSIFGI